MGRMEYALMCPKRCPECDKEYDDSWADSDGLIFICEKCDAVWFFPHPIRYKLSELS